MSDTSVTCPNCGYGYENLRKSTRMFDCPSCGTTLFRDAGALAPMGNNGEMHDYEMLFGLGDSVTAEGITYIIVGHARYDYGRGTWDEMYGENSQGKGAWISIDEGDVAIQYPYEGDAGPRRSDPLDVGETVNHNGMVYTVTESSTAKCIAVRGQFPEMVQVGDKHSFVNATGPAGELLSGEFWKGGRRWFEGLWLDPFTLKISRQDGSRAR